MATGPTLPPQAYTREILTAAFNWLQGQPESVRKIATTPDALVSLYMRARRFGDSSVDSDSVDTSQNFISELKNLAEGLKQFEPHHLKSKTTPDSDRRNSNTSHSERFANPVANSRTAKSSQTKTSPAYAKDLATESSRKRGAPVGTPQTEFENLEGDRFEIPLKDNNSSDSHEGLDQLSHEEENPFIRQSLETNQNKHLNSLTASARESFATSTVRSSKAVPSQNFRSSSSTLPVHDPKSSNSMAVQQFNDRSWQMIQEVKSQLNLSTETEAINMMLAIAYKKIKSLLG